MRLLDAAPRASGALRERLLAKGYGEAIVDEVIERLIRVQLIDDGAYAESAVRYCAGRMMGRRGTVMELSLIHILTFLMRFANVWPMVPRRLRFSART